MDVKKPIYQPEQAERTEAMRGKKPRNDKSGAEDCFAKELARCQQADSAEETKAASEQEREARVLAIKKKVADGMYKANLHEVAKNLLFNDNNEPLL